MSVFFESQDENQPDYVDYKDKTDEFRQFFHEWVESYMVRKVDKIFAPLKCKVVWIDEITVDFMHSVRQMDIGRLSFILRVWFGRGFPSFKLETETKGSFDYGWNNTSTYRVIRDMMQEAERDLQQKLKKRFASGGKS